MPNIIKAMTLQVVLLLLAVAAAGAAVSSQPQSLETLLFGRLIQSKWTRVTPSLATDRLTAIRPMESILSLRNSTGFADVLFAYQRDPTSTSNHTTRYTNLLTIRLYDTPYVNTPHTEVRLPLLNYIEQ